LLFDLKSAIDQENLNGCEDNFMICFIRQFKGQLIRNFGVKERIFIYYMMFFTAMSLFTVLTNIVSGLAVSYNYKWVGIAAICSLFFVLAYRKKKISMVHRSGVYFLSLFILPVCWLSSSGLISPSIIYSVLALIMINYLFQGWERIFLNMGQVFLALVLICLYYYSPNLFKEMTPKQQLIDWVINIPVVFGFIAILLTTLESAYETERITNIRRQKELETLSVTDSLTGLFTRNHMQEKLRTFSNVFKRTEFPYSILLIDIDFFKSFNDTHGHLAGDQCLKQFSEILKKTAPRDTDWVYRYGGEEFVILLGYTDSSGAEKVARQIQEKLRQTGIPHGASAVGEMVTVSMGIATMVHGVKDSNTLLNQADQALYLAKEQGRNQIVIQPAKESCNLVSKSSVGCCG
jgi:diguanylate cyclase (GGDEF)-like protein